MEYVRTHSAPRMRGIPVEFQGYVPCVDLNLVEWKRISKVEFYKWNLKSMEDVAFLSLYTVCVCVCVGGEGNIKGD